MEQGLASTMVYGNGNGQNVKHYYAGTVKRKSIKGKNKKKVDK